MTLTNLATGQVITLPDTLLWEDEYTWSPVITTTNYLLTGAIVIQSATKQTGRPITLVGAPDMGWITRSVLEDIRLNAAIAITDSTGRFKLTFKDGRSFNVVFRLDEVPVEAEPVLGIPPQSNTDYYRVTLRFREI